VKIIDFLRRDEKMKTLASKKEPKRKEKVEEGRANLVRILGWGSSLWTGGAYG